MQRFALVLLAATASGFELLEASATQCLTVDNCLSVPCYTSACANGYCQYTQVPIKTKCPKQSCSNGSPCDDDDNDYCNSKGECINAYKMTGTKCPGKSCSNGGACDDDANDYCDSRGECLSAYKTSRDTCRASTGECDVAEKCTGSSGTCPPDKFVKKGALCSGTSAYGACDGQDVCDGNGNCLDVYLPSSTVCRKAASTCDVSESCTGTSGACPADTYASATTPCVGVSNAGSCDDQDYCDGSGKCVDKYKSSNVVCRDTTGVCDVAEKCTGTSSTCPADVFANAATLCSGAFNDGECDGVDHCDGKGKCLDVFVPSATVCRAAATPCDVAEYCTGTASKCPVDAFASSKTKCTGTCNGNPCDGDDFCDGNGACVDGYLPEGTVCGNTANGPCTIAAVCTGDMGFCPPDSYADASVTCSGQSSGNVCDGIDKCDGNGNCADRFLKNVVCQKPVGYARPTYCNGKQATCPVAYLDTNLREEAAPELVATHTNAAPAFLLGLLCAAAVGVAFVTMRSSHGPIEHDGYFAM
ncbi:hypothetical protein SDRG_14232 [Saprolegnia diclina VS20]|uniref:Disintegrin domain-containing protein n=1 Tax=Saprolegnia diclina (strain VS20) TaxID=1156394 RepID=T0Q3J5_SAPDV|nr:hypothetical protein SDRG_14232 [Saprolegnia diclina VS20]EQC27955.1 hypothetical protein SDRG_14232 [Saprolegnia diclina VS20]|eukprot:XP_008618568.1 hypothetical protein SDRG_14232 [Saprolegnia diclina VS20]